MKKLMIVFTATALLGLNSCVKSWTCQCVVNSSTATNTTINGGSFYHAKHTCNAMVSDSVRCSLLTNEK